MKRFIFAITSFFFVSATTSCEQNDIFADSDNVLGFSVSQVTGGGRTATLSDDRYDVRNVPIIEEGANGSTGDFLIVLTPVKPKNLTTAWIFDSGLQNWVIKDPSTGLVPANGSTATNANGIIAFRERNGRVTVRQVQALWANSGVNENDYADCYVGKSYDSYCDAPIRKGIVQKVTNSGYVSYHLNN